jgi:P-type Cu2+ transporter
MDGAMSGLLTGTHDAKAEFATTTLAVANMHCGGCMRKVEKVLTDVPGVVSARANLSAKRVSAVHPPGQAQTIALIDALDQAGFVAAELTPASTLGQDATDQDFLRRIGVAGFAAANIMLLSVSVWASRGADMSPSVQSLFHWLSALIALPAIAYAGVPFFRSAAQALSLRRVNMDVPISLGVSLATLLSVYQSVRGTEQVYFDAAVTLLFFLLLGRFLDQRMRTRAAGAAANLIGLTASTATVMQDNGEIVRLSAKALNPGMRILTAAGERFAADGRLLDGTGDVDQSLITGESAPRRVEPGAFMYAGTINLSGPMLVEATSTSDNTLLAEIARLMAIAEQARGRYVRLADRAAKLYAPLVHALALLTFLGWIVAGHGWGSALTAAIAVLIITCPCALALAVPAVQVAATSRLFARGVLVKSPDALERLAEVDTVVFDKTGTLTLGRPNLVNARAVEPVVLAAAASLASASRHPYARAVIKSAQDRGLAIGVAPGVMETSGLGLERETPSGRERLGSPQWCGLASDDPRLPKACDDGSALCYRAVDGTITVFVVADALRPDAAETLAALQSGGFATEILSGDRPNAVAALAAKLEMMRYRAQLLPTDKFQRLQQLREAGHRVLMVGDGLNDAPALAAAHASLSPATAADISQTAADAVFQGDALAPIIETLAVARATRRMALQNFAIAVGYNCVFVPLAMAGHVTPLVAAIAMSASSLAVTGNALRLRTRKVKL